MLLKDNVLKALDDLYREQVMSKCSTKEECKNLRLGVLKAICVVKELPTVDAVRHGKWKSVGGKLSRFCSICGHDEPYKFADNNAHIYNYCPHCGAKMDGD